VERLVLLQNAIDKIRYAALLCVDTVLVLTKAPLHSERVLLVRLDAIGDFVLWLDAAQSIVRRYKTEGRSVVLVANAVWAEWAKDLSIFDDVIVLERIAFVTSLLYRYRLGRQVRKLGCVIALQPTYSREWLLGDAVIRISGAPERIGSSGDNSNIKKWQKRVSDRWYTRLISASAAPQMELVRNAEFMRGVGEQDFRAKVSNLSSVNSPPMKDPLIGMIPAGQKYYVLFPGASWDGKQWQIGNFSQIAQELYSKTGWHGVVCGGPADRAIAADLCGQCNAQLLNWAGRTDLSQLATILSNAQLLVTNDTSATHIAAACGVRTVCILGGGQYGRFMPYKVEQEDGRPLPREIIHQMPCFGCNWQCIYERSSSNPVPCIERVSVSEVWQAISEALGISV
jgi:ADP-heptose:LPS heptosyltransferase